MDDRRMDDRRKAMNGQGSFFILQLLSVIRRYKMEHLKSSSKMRCDCPICSEAERLLDEGKPDNPNRWG